jgi:hypothetical protein
MLCCPALSPFSLSNRFEGGMRNDFSSLTAVSISSFLAAVLWIFFGSFRENLPLNNLSASLHLKVLII